MTDIDLRRTLEIQAREYAGRIDAISRDLHRAHSTDAEEQAVERENDDVLNALLEEARAGLQAVTHALTRLEQGTYGRCERCGEPIQAQRLAAMPTTPFCLHCAEQQT